MDENPCARRAAAGPPGTHHHRARRPAGAVHPGSHHAPHLTVSGARGSRRARRPAADARPGTRRARCPCAPAARRAGYRRTRCRREPHPRNAADAPGRHRRARTPQVRRCSTRACARRPPAGAAAAHRNRAIPRPSAGLRRRTAARDRGSHHGLRRPGAPRPTTSATDPRRRPDRDTPRRGAPRLLRVAGSRPHEAGRPRGAAGTRPDVAHRRVHPRRPGRSRHASHLTGRPDRGTDTHRGRRRHRCSGTPLGADHPRRRRRGTRPGADHPRRRRPGTRPGAGRSPARGALLDRRHPARGTHRRGARRRSTRRAVRSRPGSRHPTTTAPTGSRPVVRPRRPAGLARNRRACAHVIRDRRCSSVALLEVCGIHHPRHAEGGSPPRSRLPSGRRCAGAPEPTRPGPRGCSPGRTWSASRRTDSRRARS